MWPHVYVLWRGASPVCASLVCACVHVCMCALMAPRQCEATRHGSRNKHVALTRGRETETGRQKLTD
eukprot:11732257-Alexandrium_andersonii.AAC.1